MTALLFVFGAAFGSFFNVVALRHTPGGALFGSHLFGRSRCSSCRRTLQWYELVPIASFVAQLGRCRSCGARVSVQYPIVELLAGAVVAGAYAAYGATPFALVWALIGLTLLLLSVVDALHFIIPDSLNLTLAALGIALLFVAHPAGSASVSSLGYFAYWLGAPESVFMSRLLGALAGGGFFALVILGTGGRAMGWGDAKLALVGGVILGFPDIGLAAALSFILGTIAVLPLLATGRRSLRDLLPFGPFLALGIALTAFFGYDILKVYFSLFGIL